MLLYSGVPNWDSSPWTPLAEAEVPVWEGPILFGVPDPPLEAVGPGNEPFTDPASAAWPVAEGSQGEIKK